MPYTTKGKCVYKKNEDGTHGKKVGCTKGSVKKYLAALHANVSESKTKKDLLNEIAGVPTSIQHWVHLFSDIIVKKIEQALKEEGWQEESEGSVPNPETGEEDDITVYRTIKVFDGKDVMESFAEKFGGLKEFIKSDTFKSLPIWRPDIELVIVGVPQYVYDANFRGRSNVNASMISRTDVNKLSKIGKQPVMSHINFKFYPYIPEDTLNGISEDTKKDIKKSVLTTVGHELLHAYQMFKQMESGKPAHFGPETLLNTLTQHPEIRVEILKEWNEFLNLVYLHISPEINARINEMYYEMKREGVKTKEEFLKILKASHIWDELKRLESFSAKQFMNDFKLPEIPKTGNPFEDMLASMLGGNLLKMELKMRGLTGDNEEEILKQLINIWDEVLQLGSKAMKNLHDIDIPMDRVPKKAKEDPYYFFKFFEKRFHKNSKIFKRKLYKLASIIVTE